MILIEDNSTSDYDVTIMVDDEYKTCYMRLDIRNLKMTVVDRNYPNATSLSADFRCRIGYGPAVDILTKAGIPKSSKLWHLNHGP